MLKNPQIRWRAVLFDFDGVTAETLPSHISAWQRVLERDSHATLDEMVIRLNEGRPVIEMVKKIIEHTEMSFGQADVEKLIAKKNDEFQKHHKARVYKPIPSILDKIHQRGASTGLVTGTTLENIKTVLSLLLIDKFDVIIADGDTVQGKPAPDPYLAAADRLGVNPKDCVVVENAPVGIASAKSAGMMCIALATTLDKEHLAQADVKFDNHFELLELFDFI